MPTITRSSIADPIRPAEAAQPAVGAEDRAVRLEQGAAVLAGGIALAVPFAAFAALTLHHFYVGGSFLLDAGWTAYLVSHGGLLLPYPTALGGDSYYHWHVGPILTIFGLLRRALPLSDIQYFAAFAGLCHALPALAVFWVLRAGYGLRRGIAVGIAALVAIAFALSGNALAIARYPHSEMLIVAAVMLFAAALVMRRPAMAAIWFVVALLTREDAGLHIFGLLLVLVVVNRRYGAPWREQRTELAFAAAGLAHGILVLAAQRLLSTMPSTMALTYFGDPPLAHLSIESLLLRLQFLLTYRAYLVFPALVAAIWAVRTRNPYILIGYIACLPWVALQLAAYSDIAGTLSGYYAFPLMIAAFWPLLGVLLDRRQRGTAGGAAPPVIMFAGMIAASFVGIGQQYNPGRLALPAAFLAPPSYSSQLLTDRAIIALAASKPQLGSLAAGTSVVALAPDLFTPAETALPPRPMPPNAVAYLAQGFDSDKARQVAAAAGPNRHYRVPGTALRLATEGAVPAGAPIAALLAPAEPPD
jgi:hypothetical protein